MRVPRVRLTMQQMMAIVAITAVYFAFLRTDLVLGLWAMGITLPAFLWVLETERVAGFRGQALTVADRFVAFALRSDVDRRGIRRGRLGNRLDHHPASPLVRTDLAAARRCGCIEAQF